MQASISGVDLMINLWYKSDINLQNQTLGAAAGDDQVTDVTNNPVEGRIYEGKGTGFTPKFYDVTAAAGLTAENSFLEMLLLV